jgi:arginyl-tRNA--protein-N-Asp/Glu arginylyltransferase
MAYKINFQPLEGLVDGQWRALPPGTEPPGSA